MEELTKQIKLLKNNYSDIIVEIGTMTADYINGNVSMVKNYDSVITKSNEIIKQIDDLMFKCFSFISTNNEIQDEFVELMVSMKPRLECEIEQLKEAKNHPGKRDESLYDNDFQLMTNGKGNEILEEIYQETQRINELKERDRRRISNDINQDFTMTSEEFFSREFKDNINKNIQEFGNNNKPKQEHPTGFLDSEEEEDEIEFQEVNYGDQYAFPEVDISDNEEREEDPLTKLILSESKKPKVQIDENKLQMELLNSFLGITVGNSPEEEEEEEEEEILK